MRRSCDWCFLDAVYAFHVRPPQGVKPDDPLTIDFCQADALAAIEHVARMTNDRVYPAEVGFVVIDA